MQLSRKVRKASKGASAYLWLLAQARKLIPKNETPGIYGTLFIAFSFTILGLPDMLKGVPNTVEIASPGAFSPFSGQIVLRIDCIQNDDQFTASFDLFDIIVVVEDDGL